MRKATDLVQRDFDFDDFDFDDFAHFATRVDVMPGAEPVRFEVVPQNLIAGVDSDQTADTVGSHH